MRTLIIILLYFNAFGQVDTIQPPCNLTRQQTRLWHDLRETQLKLFDAQHKRENTKEIKSLKYGVRSLRLENKNIKREYEFKQDSIKRFNRLLLAQERNRTKETKKTLTANIKQQENEYKILKKETNKKVNANIVWIICGIAGILLLILVVMLVKRSK